jgi:hypothetical protein
MMECAINAARMLLNLIICSSSIALSAEEKEVGGTMSINRSPTIMSELHCSTRLKTQDLCHYLAHEIFARVLARILRVRRRILPRIYHRKSDTIKVPRRNADRRGTFVCVDLGTGFAMVESGLLNLLFTL